MAPRVDDPLSKAAAARYLGVGDRTLRRLVDEGKVAPQLRRRASTPTWRRSGWSREASATFACGAARQEDLSSSTAWFEGAAALSVLGVLGVQTLFEVGDERVVGLVRRGRRGLDIHRWGRRRLHGRGRLMLFAVHLGHPPRTVALARSPEVSGVSPRMFPGLWVLGVT